MCLKCERLKAEHAPPEAFPVHINSPEIRKKRSESMIGKPESCRRQGYTQEQRAQMALERFEQRKARRVKIPQMWADAKVRLARIRQIWKIMKITQEDFARKLGIPYQGLHKIFKGERPCNWMHLKLAERLLREERQRQHVRNYERKQRLKKAGIVLQPAVEIPIPDNPKLRASAIRLYMQKKSVDEIARELALRPEVVEKWIAAVG